MEKTTLEYIDEMVNKEIYCNQTMLINECIGKEIITTDEIENFYTKECSECGGTLEEMSDEDIEAKELLQGAHQCADCGFTFGEEAAQDLERETEVYEWYAISDWLARKLKDRNEVIIQNGLGTWWGRGATGQAIAMDSVIEKIWTEANIPL